MNGKKIEGMTRVNASILTNRFSTAIGSMTREMVQGSKITLMAHFILECGKTTTNTARESKNSPMDHRTSETGFLIEDRAKGIVSTLTARLILANGTTKKGTVKANLNFLMAPPT